MRFSLPGNHPPLKLRALAGSHSRRGILLPIVMVVIVLAALSCYQFADRMTTERQVVSYLKQESQAHQAALSGIDYAIALLTDPELDPQDFLSLTPEEYAWQVILPGNEAAEVPNDLMVTLVSRDLTYQQGSVMFGVGLESGKINLNALAELDVPLEDQRQVLLGLPDMTESMADTILDFIDADSTPRDFGTESDDGDYLVRNAPLTSLDDLLAIPEITAEMLHGEDANRNGLLDPEEDDGNLREPMDDEDGTLYGGWSEYLTLWSRESNLQSDGYPRINLNDSDLNQLQSDLATEFGDDLAEFVILYRQYGPQNANGQGQQQSGGNSGGGGGGGGSGGSGNLIQRGSSGGSSSGGSSSGGGNRSSGGGNSSGVQEFTPTDSSSGTGSGSQSSPSSGSTSGSSGRGGGSSQSGGGSSTGVMQIQSQSVTSSSSSNNSTGGGGGAGGTGGTQGGQISGLYQLQSPYELIGVAVNTGTETILSPWTTDDLSFVDQLERMITTVEGESRSGRIDLNHAPYEVLASLPNIPEALVDEILAGQGTWVSPAELLENGQIDVAGLVELEPFLTARSRTYRFQSIGFWKSGGPTVRIEAVVDLAGPEPVILMHRNLTAAGPGYSVDTLLQQDQIIP